jgi:hypothetical protein
MSKQVPYNTGKVRIGEQYTAPSRVAHTYETNFWQDVLLGEHARKQKRRSWAALYGVLVVCVFSACVVWL